MDLLNTLIGLLPDPWGAITIATLTFLGALVTFASSIVPFTKTPTDDKIVDNIKAFLWRFSVFDPKDNA